VISFSVIGVPAPKGSWRSVRKRNGKGHAFISDNPKSAPWADSVAWAARAASQGRMFDTPVHITIEFRLPRPPSIKRKWPSTKPDLDKLERNALDALKGILLSDDSRVVKLTSTKVYADGQAPGATITIEEAV
jgi:Holliday junction resolvase RusA-like endonuclease